YLPVKRADRLADDIHDRIPDARDLRTARTRELPNLPVDPQNLVLVMAAVEGDAPYLVAGHRAAVGDGEIDAPVAHLPDVLNRRIGGSRRRRCPRIEQQIVRDAVVQVRREI